MTSLNPEFIISNFITRWQKAPDPTPWKEYMKKGKDNKEKLLQYLEAAKNGDLDSWKNSPEQRLALLWVFDQAPRIILSGPKMYQTDEKARELTKMFIEEDDYKNLSLTQQMFVFFPYHHSENIEHQKIALKHFTHLHESNPKKFEWIWKSSQNYNIVIKRFGRFPHRAEDLNREPTKEEKEFMEKGGEWEQMWE